MTTESKDVCWVCGQKVRSPVHHVLTKHRSEIEDFADAFIEDRDIEIVAKHQQKGQEADQ